MRAKARSITVRYIISCSQNGWSGCSAAERPFKMVRQSLSGADSIVCKSDSVILPIRLRNRTLQPIKIGSLVARLLESS